MIKKAILAIESSCDDTSIALVDTAKRILFHKTISSSHIHAKVGGIVPMTAAGCHAYTLPRLIASVANTPFDAVAVTYGPGIAPCLSVGLTTARTISAMRSIPLIGVNHMEGHLLSACVVYPFVGLLVSGGHTMLVHAKGFDDYTLLGNCLDDAVGEAYDKVARLLHLDWKGNERVSGGAAVESIALKAICPIDFPIPLLKSRHHHASMDFSFAGLKSAVKEFVARNPPSSEIEIANICQGFQNSVVAHLKQRVQRALELTSVNSLVIAGGVSMNRFIKSSLSELNVIVTTPPAALCCDNAAMIGFVGVEKFIRGRFNDFSLQCEPKLLHFSRK